jgi:hypothetical protein
MTTPSDKTAAQKTRATSEEKRLTAVVSDIKGQSRRSSVAQDCHEALGEALALALTGLLHPNNAGRALMQLQKRFPSTCDDIVRTL